MPDDNHLGRTASDAPSGVMDIPLSWKPSWIVAALLGKTEDTG